MRRVTEWSGSLARLVVGGVWIVAGVAQAARPRRERPGVRAYQLLPEAVVPTVGHAAADAGDRGRRCACSSGCSPGSPRSCRRCCCVAFIIGISSAWARGLSIDCGCFGGGRARPATRPAKYPWEIARDVGLLLLLSAWLVWRPRTPLAVDNLLLPRRPDRGRTRRDATTRDGEEEVHRHPPSRVDGPRRRAAAAIRAAQRSRSARAAAADRDHRRSSWCSRSSLVIGYLVQLDARHDHGRRPRPRHRAPSAYAVPVGPTSAPVKVVVYEDFLCPFCGEFESRQPRACSARHVEQGKVQVQYHVARPSSTAAPARVLQPAANALAVVLDDRGP